MGHQWIEINGQRADGDNLALTIALDRQDTVELISGRANPSSHQGDGVIATLPDTQPVRTGGELSDVRALRLISVRGERREESSLRVTQQGLEIKTPGSGMPFQAVFVSARSGSLEEDAVRLGQLRTRKQGDLLTQALRIVEPRLQSVEDVSASGAPMLWGDIGLPELVPLSAMGEGMIRVSRLVLAISSAPGGVVLVDEIENGIHYSVMSKVWAAVAEAAREFDTQLFATTHSFECVAAAHDTLAADHWRYHRLDRTSAGTSRWVTYGPRDVEAAVRHGLEAR